MFMSVLPLSVIQLFLSCICLLNVQSSCCPFRALNWSLNLKKIVTDEHSDNIYPFRPLDHSVNQRAEHAS